MAEVFSSDKASGFSTSGRWGKYPLHTSGLDYCSGAAVEDMKAGPGQASLLPEARNIMRQYPYVPPLEENYFSLKENMVVLTSYPHPRQKKKRRCVEVKLAKSTQNLLFLKCLG